MSDETSAITADTVLDFWFDQAGPSKWFGGGDAFDADIRARFETLVLDIAAALRRKEIHAWSEHHGGILSLIICLDQFPRNMYRGTKAAFAFDDLALNLARRAIDEGYDLKIPIARRSFIYMPFMHSENKDDQAISVKMADQRLDSESVLFHAKEHEKLILKFGRFAHRNAVLGRKNTDAETQYLNEGGYSP